MTYQVLARKYRPQSFADVVGQRGVTETLRNALARERLAQAFVFAGPRGVGKTTTARILARALNCADGPTPTPCGECNACREIAEGRDIDVLEIDAATHTQVENIREVIIAGLAVAPVRNRYKVYIIDEVHQLSGHSFNALLKSIEEPPPHAVFMMATTELGRIPDTILSRSQVYEFRTIGRQAIVEQLEKIAVAESLTIDPEAFGLIARAADGSMRDAQSALDQVIAFAGETIRGEDVSAVLGLIGRDAVLDVVEAVADEDPGPVFDLAGRFVEAGFDLRAVCRELVRAVRDVMAVAIDPRRVNDPEIAAESERERLTALAGRFSREDLLRGFDVVVRAEVDMRGAAQPRFHLEMALLRWMHLRGLVPLADLLAGTAPAAPSTGGGRAAGRAVGVKRASERSSAPSDAGPTTRGDGASAPRAPQSRRASGAATTAPPAVPPAAAAPTASPSATAVSAAGAATAPAGRAAPPAGSAAPAAPSEGNAAAARPAPAADAKAAVLAEIRRGKKFLHGTVVAQAQRITLRDGRLVFAFTPEQPTLVRQIEQNRKWIEQLATRVVGQPIVVSATAGDGTAPDRGAGRDAAAAASDRPATDAPAPGLALAPAAATNEAAGTAGTAASDVASAGAQALAAKADPGAQDSTAPAPGAAAGTPRAGGAAGTPGSAPAPVAGTPEAKAAAAAPATNAPAGADAARASGASAEAERLRARAMQDSVIRSMLDLLPAEIDSVEKI